MTKTNSIVIKIGTNVITTRKGLLDMRVMKRIVARIASLKKQGWSIVVVTSGAMGAGRSLLTLKKRLDSVSARQVLAAIGQPLLINAYATLFKAHGIICAQVLAAKEDFRDRDHYKNMRQCLTALRAHDVVPLVNENDVVSVSELMFTDNDELAGLVATLVNATRLVILTTVDGIADEAGATIRTVSAPSDVSACIRPDTSSFGRGGMQTKCAIALRLARLGITTHIINGHNAAALESCCTDASKHGTTFPAKKIERARKQWLAHARGTERGTIILNAGAAAALAAPDKAASILPVGIVQIDGVFQKGDVVKIHDERGALLGYGRAEYASAEAHALLGKRGHRPLVHYNYLFIDV